MDNENLRIVDKLNDHLYNEKHDKYQFIFSMSPNGFQIELQEMYETGQSFLVFDSNDSIPDTIEELYEKDIFSYEEMVIKVIQHNIRLHIEHLKEIHKITFSL
jgi:hypothetical protein